ncbi:hypothetical protein [Streptomyces halobius]|uniref:Uncharacterized protein n=1 Tax=Streptomyces halobius TaxID=2879846 RepID=A0ABY4MDT4_9ACTN|nr:hypothetical protein [Streptomyces halobius]UQA94516.1 hypothetical protein K9S39_24005 [Streptomyces halobius]
MTVVAWAAGVGAASVLGACSLAGTVDRGAGAAPMDDAAVRQQLAEARSASPGPSATASPPPPPSTSLPSAHANTATVRVTGGSISAACRADGRIYLTAWSPATGYHVDDDVTRGPVGTATVEFEPLDDAGGEDRPYDVHCADGRPKATPVPDQDDADD